MKIFWSWQSDTPGKIGRHFIRDVLQAAIDELKETIEVDEPTEREARAAIHLDHDRKGISGSPDLARVILEKIEQSGIFVADVTSVGVIHEKPDDQSSSAAKKVINPNIAIELGYALHSLTDRSLLMVMNEHYGARADLPFDLQSKAGPITFNLSDNADKVAIAREARLLKAKFVEAIKLCLANRIETGSGHQPFAETPAGLTPAIFFAPNDVLAGFGHPGEQEYRIDSEKLAYIRVFPTNAEQPSVGLAKLTAIFEQRRISVMSRTVGGLSARNSHGPIIVDPVSGSTISALTQGFASGELWGVNSALFMPHRIQVGFPPRAESGVMIPMVTFEDIYLRTLQNYLAVAASELKLRFPYTIELGIVGLKDTYLAVPGGYSGQGQLVGPVLQNVLQRRYSLNETSNSSVMDILRSYFIDVYDLAACDRASVLPEQLITTRGLPCR